MCPSRYKPSRTLVRRLCRLPGEPKAEFKAKIDRLRAHFERFNRDVADLCQWLMALRPKEGSEPALNEFWNFFLVPRLESVEAPEIEADRWRLAAFDQVAGSHPVAEIAGRRLPDALRVSIEAAKCLPKTPNASQLFDRLGQLDSRHRLVLLKAAAEWVFARYQRAVDNYERQHAAWQQEKQAWEAEHPELTAAVRECFTSIFKNLLTQPTKEQRQQLRRKNPRICRDERLRENKDNCEFAGQNGHGPLCWKFDKFVNAREKKRPGFRDHFIKDAIVYIKARNAPHAQKKGTKYAHQAALEQVYKADQNSKHHFKEDWNEYLRTLGLNSDTVLKHCQLPHCQKLSRGLPCLWNPHTELCTRYRKALDALAQETRKLEPQYREWRRYYLAGPRKPSFRYPSCKTLPMPKIFGSGFFDVDLRKSILRVRLDDMREGEAIALGFQPWPRGYRPGRDQVQVTSVHVNFVGRRARAGFRFDVPPQTSRFACLQDEIDELRSRQFPRQAQDQEFLDAARKRLLDSFAQPETELRLLAVDLGDAVARGVVCAGRAHRADVLLRTLKIDVCYPSVPDALKVDRKRASGKPKKFDPAADPRGVRKEHVGRHLVQLREAARRIAQARGSAAPELRASDHRGLVRHIRHTIRDWARNNAARIVAAAEKWNCDLIVFESLRGFAPPGYHEMDALKKRRMAFFAYGQIRRKVAEKAVERGMRMVTVPYGYSSQVCSACGHLQLDTGRLRNNKQKRRFECECHKYQGDPAHRHCSCNAKLDSDINAARVLARVFWDEIKLPTRTEAERDRKAWKSHAKAKTHKKPATK